jgi:Protein of unknown function (DUF3050)
MMRLIYVSHLDLYRRAMADIGASTLQFDRFRSLARAGVPVEAALAQIGTPSHVQAFVAHTMALANSGSTEEGSAAFFCGREDIIRRCSAGYSARSMVRGRTMIRSVISSTISAGISNF